jgi:MurNAc alpha-1-phosphate uridylyltransferase
MKIKTALILCAGLGERLHPLTLQTPKPLLHLKNTTMLENCINLVIKLGIKKIYLNTFYLSEQFFSFIKSKNFPIDIKIFEDGKKILNTGGGILNMIKECEDDNYLIFNPDTVWSINYIKDINRMVDFYISNNLNNLLLMTQKNFSFDTNLLGDFNLNKNLADTKGNKNFIFIGCQILNKRLFDDYKISNFPISKIWKTLLKKNKLNGFETKNKFYHLTDIKIFKKLKDF